MLQNGRDVRGDEVFSLAEAEDQWAVLLDADQGVRAVGAEHAQSIAAFQILYGTLHGLQEAALLLVIVFDQVGHDLRVRFGRELLAVSGKEFLQRQIVFNDAVVHQADFFV